MIALIGATEIITLVVALTAALLLVATRQWHGHYSLDSQVGVQKFHSAPTPRVGGIAVFLAVLMGALLAPARVQMLLLPLLLAGTPAFAIGLLEDTTKRVSVRLRLLVTTCCGVLGWFITGHAITDVNVQALDWLLEFTLISVLFTGFAVGGISNAINIIDGFNGLTGGTVLIILTGFALIAQSFGDTALVCVCLLLGAAVAGFLLVNWPWGRIFLGDGGAYFIGFALAWVAVLMLGRHPQVSAWAPMLVCGYPILEVFFSIWRRRKRHLSPGAPDRLHLHSLVRRRLAPRFTGSACSLQRNSLTGALMWIPALVPVAIAVQWPTHTPSLVVGFAICVFLYSAVYARLSQFRWCWGTATLATRSASK